LGLATDEGKGYGVNPNKREKLIRAGAEAIAGDFSGLPGLIGWMNLGGQGIGL